MPVQYAANDMCKCERISDWMPTRNAGNRATCQHKPQSGSQESSSTATQSCEHGFRLFYRLQTNVLSVIWKK